MSIFSAHCIGLRLVKIKNTIYLFWCECDTKLIKEATLHT